MYENSTHQSKYGDPCGSWTHDPRLKIWCLNRLTKGPYGSSCGSWTRVSGLRIRSLDRLTKELYGEASETWTHTPDYSGYSRISNPLPYRLGLSLRNWQYWWSRVQMHMLWSVEIRYWFWREVRESSPVRRNHKLMWFRCVNLPYGGLDGTRTRNLLIDSQAFCSFELPSRIFACSDCRAYIIEIFLYSRYRYWILQREYL